MVIEPSARIREGADEAEVRFQASTAVLDELNITGADETQIVTDDQPSTREWPSIPQRTAKLFIRLPKRDRTGQALDGAK